MEKTIYQIAFTETIVFSCEGSETLITFAGGGLRWWMSFDPTVDASLFTLIDTLDHPNDLSRAPIAYARKLASDWYNFTLRTGEGNEDSEEEVTLVPFMVLPDPFYGPVRPPMLCPIRPISTLQPEKTHQIVEPGWVDENKKDAHTEHCCATHSRCFYRNKKCSVVTGKKKASYACRCEERRIAA